MSTQIYDTDNLDRAWFTYQLKEAEAITLNLDPKVSGVGCTAISVLNQYRVLPEKFEFTFHLKPFTKGPNNENKSKINSLGWTED